MTASHLFHVFLDTHADFLKRVRTIARVFDQDNTVSPDQVLIYRRLYLFILSIYISFIFIFLIYFLCVRLYLDLVQNGPIKVKIDFFFLVKTF